MYLLILLILGACNTYFKNPYALLPLHYQPKFEFFQLSANEKMITTTYTSFTTKKLEKGYVFRSFYGEVLVQETNYQDKSLRVKNGSFKQFDLYDGKLEFEQMYQNDQLNGKRTYYYKSGKIKSITPFLNNMKNGKGVDYYESGAVKVEYEYKDDIETIPRVYYHENGTIKAKITTHSATYQQPEHSHSHAFPRGYPTYTNVNPIKYNNYLNGMFKLFDSMGQEVCVGIYEEGKLMTPECHLYDSVEELNYMRVNSHTMPKFPGGDVELLKFFGSNIKYPPLAKQHDVQGMVILSFTIDENGGIEDLKIVRGIDPTIAEEALRLAKQMPKWSPGKVNGKPVKVAFKLPIRFKLE